MGYRSPTLFAVLRRSRTVAGLALVAAYLQVMVVAGALAMEAAHLTDAPFGITGPASLYLCHSDDTDYTTSDQEQPAKPPSHCLLILTAQSAGHAMVPATSADPAPLRQLTVRVVSLASYLLPIAPRLRYGTSRGPPSFVRV
jgi:hypothetical protein